MSRRAGARAGFAKAPLSSSLIGAELVGYANRRGRAAEVHDPLYVRVAVFEHGTERVAVCSVDLCAVHEDVVAAIRARVEQQTGIPADHVFLAATHTHSAPADDDRSSWPDGLAAPIAAAVEQAVVRLRPARAGVGWGFLYGHSLNRRRLESPVDPAVLVARIDGEDGRSLGLLYGFACHPVVHGPDSCVVTGDWPAHASATIEQHHGEAAVAVFLQGACADINPLTSSLLRRFVASECVLGQVAGATYYGDGHGHGSFAIGDRTGGSSGEAVSLGNAVAIEALRVRKGVAPRALTSLWVRRVGLRRRPVQRRRGPLEDHLLPRAAGYPFEVMLIRLGGPDLLLVGQPGEVFAATGIHLRQVLRASGVAHPFVVGYANGWRGYLPPVAEYADGGYEIEWARALDVPLTLQQTVAAQVVHEVTTG